MHFLIYLRELDYIWTIYNYKTLIVYIRVAVQWA